MFLLAVGILTQHSPKLLEVKVRFRLGVVSLKVQKCAQMLIFEKQNLVGIIKRSNINTEI